MASPKTRKHQLVFRWKESPVLLGELVSRGYSMWDPIIAVTPENWELFITEETSARLANEGYARATSGDWFVTFEHETRAAGQLFSALKSIDPKALGDQAFLEELTRISELIVSFWQLYAATEFVYYAKAEQELARFIDGKHAIEDVLSGRVETAKWPHAPKHIAEHMRAMQHFKLEMRQLVNDIVMGPHSLIMALQQEVLRRIPDKDAAYLTSHEIMDALVNKTIPDVHHRTKAVVFVWDQSKNRIEPHHLDKSREIIARLHRELPSDEVRGTPACAGIVRAEARIIPLSLQPKKYLQNMKLGCILVADTTGPELMEAVRKAVAIVTDEGGLMSHAAVVAREFKIPCIVGAKVATKVFQDGDIIEVDATKGIARLISRKR